tara:strand:+ start:3667 stop:4155 length:489 start_codon:yes stop_codon:yes gene_type:complete
MTLTKHMGLPYGRIGLFIALLIASMGPAWAAEPKAAPAPSTPWENMSSVALGLLAVLAVIFLSAWLVRRLQGMQGPNNNAVKTLAVLPVGQRERIALLEVGGTQLLVGITAQSIRTLHVFDEPVVDAAGTGGNGDFASRLQAMLSKGVVNQGRGTKQKGNPE